MKAYKLTYDYGIVEYYPIENGNCGTFLDSAWNNTIVPIQVEEIEVEKFGLRSIREGIKRLLENKELLCYKQVK